MGAALVLVPPQGLLIEAKIYAQADIALHPSIIKRPEPTFVSVGPAMHNGPQRLRCELRG